MGRQSAADVVRTYLANVQHARLAPTPVAWQQVQDALAEDVRWRFAGDGAGDLWAVELSGRSEVTAALAQPSNAWTRLRTQTTSIVSCDPVVLVEQVTTLVDDASVETTKPVAHVFSVDDGLITDIRTYRNDRR